MSDSYNFRVTDNAGRAGNFLSQEAFTEGTYKMVFDTGAYYKELAVKSFYPYIEASKVKHYFCFCYTITSHIIDIILTKHLGCNRKENVF